MSFSANTAAATTAVSIDSKTFHEAKLQEIADQVTEQKKQETLVAKYMKMPVSDLVKAFIDAKYTSTNKQVDAEYDALTTAFFTRINDPKNIDAKQSEELAAIRGKIDHKLDSKTATPAEILFAVITRSTMVSEHRHNLGGNRNHYDPIKIKELITLLEKQVQNNPALAIYLREYYRSEENWAQANHYSDIAMQAEFSLAYHLSGMALLKGQGTTPDLSESERRFKIAAQKGVLLSQEGLIWHLFSKRFIHRNDIFEAILKFQRLAAEQNFVSDYLKESGIQWNTKTQSFDFAPHYDFWLYQQMIKSRKDTSAIHHWSQLPKKMISLMTDDSPVFLKALVETVRKYREKHGIIRNQRTPEQDQEYLISLNSHHSFMTQKLLHLIDTFNNKYLEKNSKDSITLEQFASHLQTFFNAEGGTNSNSMKYFIMDELLKHYAGTNYDSASPAFWNAEKFTALMLQMVEMAKNFDKECLQPLTKLNAIEKTIQTQHDAKCIQRIELHKEFAEQIRLADAEMQSRIKSIAASAIVASAPTMAALPTTAANIVREIAAPTTINTMIDVKTIDLSAVTQKFTQRLENYQQSTAATPTAYAPLIEEQPIIIVVNPATAAPIASAPPASELMYGQTAATSPVTITSDNKLVDVKIADAPVVKSSAPVASAPQLFTPDVVAQPKPANLSTATIISLTDKANGTENRNYSLPAQVAIADSNYDFDVQPGSKDESIELRPLIPQTTANASAAAAAPSKAQKQPASVTVNSGSGTVMLQRRK